MSVALQRSEDITTSFLAKLEPLTESLSEDVLPEGQRMEQLERYIAQIRTSEGTSGRNGRPWREWIHEGHQD